MRNALLVVLGATSIASAADAGFLGFVASTRTAGGFTFVDVFCAVSNASDKFLNVYNANITTTVASGFYQSSASGSTGWKPDTVLGVATRASYDSFMTAGAYQVPPPPTVYAGITTSADPNFTSASWLGTVAPSAANSVPQNAGWYTNDPFSAENSAESLSGLVNRVNSGATPADGATPATVGSAGAQYGIWCAHLVLNTTNAITFGPNGNLQFNASASIKDGVNGTTSQGASNLPAPGALAVLGLAGVRSHRRRR
jgi:MYXO-CTERM domain-containing protein